jgi:hypothetical protein
MALSKASKPPLLFTTKASNAVGGDADVLTAVGRQWKLKEVVYQRDTGAGVTSVVVTVKLKDLKTGHQYLIATDTMATGDLDSRIMPTLSTGEYFVDADCEVHCTTSGAGASDPWSLRITGSLVA